MPLLKHVNPDGLREHWPRVREGLKRLECMSPDWMAEDAYHLLRTGLDRGGAMLSLINGDDGFMIWQRYPGDDGRGMLFVLALVGDGMLKHYTQLNAELDALARELQCRRIRHISKHTEWADLRWTLLGHVYEREI